MIVLSGKVFWKSSVFFALPQHEMQSWTLGENLLVCIIIIPCFSIHRAIINHDNANTICLERR